MTIKIKSSDLRNIIDHCVEESPVEACGVLAGNIGGQGGVNVREVQKVYRCRNELESSTEYRIEVEELFKTFSEIDDLGLTPLGFYHSHPHTVSRPSSSDEERSNYYGYSYIIVALNPIRVSSWILEEKGIFKEEEILVM